MVKDKSKKQSSSTPPNPVCATEVSKAGVHILVDVRTYPLASLKQVIGEFFADNYINVLGDPAGELIVTLRPKRLEPSELPSQETLSFIGKEFKKAIGAKVTATKLI